MKESQLLGKLFSAHPDLLPILKNIMDKYDIPEIEPGQDSITEFILMDNPVGLDVVRQEILEQIRNNPDLLPPELVPLYKGLKEQQKFPDPETIVIDEPVSDKLKAQIIELYKFFFSTMKMWGQLTVIVDNYYQLLADASIEYLIYREVRDIPPDWFGKVFTSSIFSQPVVIAIAGQLTEPKEITKEFSTEINRVFGKDRPKITQGSLNTADYLAMKLKGMPIRDIADEYILRHSEQFPKDPESKSYRAAKKRLQERLRKGIQRLQNDLRRWTGDKKQLNSVP